jgi:hypothetical protein
MPRESDSEDSQEERPVRRLPNLRLPFVPNLKRVVLNVADTQYSVVS